MLSAVFTFHLINSAILTGLVSMFVLWRYRVAVLSGMRRGDQSQLPLPDLQPFSNKPRDQGSKTLLAWERRRQLEIALAYLVATLCCALVLASAQYIRDLTLWPSQIFMLALVYSFACAPMIATSLALRPMKVLTGLALLTALLTGMAVGGLLFERVLRGLPVYGRATGQAQIFLGLVSSQMWLVALFWLTAWPRKLRGVAPITFAALVLFSLGPLLGSRRLQGTPSMGLNGMFVLMSLPSGGLAWAGVRRIARAYERKRFSDAQLLSRTYWLMLVTNVWLQMATNTRHPWFVVEASVAAFLLLAPTSAFFLSSMGKATIKPPARNLLLLRVFGYTRRTERLFDRIAARWRLFGPVTMIVAPDVAARTIDPADYLRWLTERTDEFFVTSRADLTARLLALDMAPDPDGRYRVNEFCCRDNTWQATVVELIQRADAVVMDVRGVTRSRHGCEFELEQLSQRLPLRRLVLVADATTDRGVLETAFGPQLSEVQLIEAHRWSKGGAILTALLEAAA